MPPTPTAIVARNTTYQFIAKAITVALSMVTFALVARLLSVVEYGQFTVISTIFALVIGLSDLRIEQVVVRDTADNEDRLNYLASQATWAKFGFTVLVISITLILVSLSNYSNAIKICVSIVMAGVLLNALFAGFHSAIQHYLRAYLLTFAEVIAKVIVAVLIVVVCWLGWQSLITSSQALLIFVTIAMVISPLIVLVCYSYWAIRKLNVRLHFTLDRSLIGSLLCQSWPLWLLGILALVHYRAGVMILSAMQSDYDVGIFGLAYRFIDVAVTLPPLFIASVYPLMSRYATTNSDKSKSVFVKSFNFMLIFVALLAGGTFYAAPQVITLFGGAGYIQAAVVLQILSLAMVGSYLATIYVPFLVASRAQRFAVWASATSVVANITLNLLLIPHYSYYGAAIAIAASELIGFLVVAIAVKYKLGASPRILMVLKVAVALIAMLAVLELSHLAGNVSGDIWQAAWRLAAIGLLGLVVYGFFIWRLKVIDSDILEQSLSMLPIPSRMKKTIHG